MDNTINGRTPEEIKKGLECRKQGYAEQCGYGCSKCDVYVPGYLIWDLINDTLAYIQQLECERDAAVEDLTIIVNNTGSCIMCKHRIHPGYVCDRFEREENCYEWRGVQEVE